MRNTISVPGIRLAARQRRMATVSSVSTLDFLLDISVGQAMSYDNSWQGNNVNFVAEPRVVDRVACDLNPRLLHRHGANGGFKRIPFW